MAVGDGATWDETTPTDGTTAVEIDDYNRDLRLGIRARFAREHEMPASQSATSEGGAHKFITMQEQGAKPTVSGTQKSALYTDTSNNLVYEKSSGTIVNVVVGTAVGDSKILANATDAAAGYLGDKLNATYLTLSGTSVVLASSAVAIYNYKAAVNTGTAQNAAALKMAYGAVSLGAAASTSITGLPFTNTTSYSICCQHQSTGDLKPPNVSPIDGGNAGIAQNHPDTRVVNWIAVGV